MWHAFRFEKEEEEKQTLCRLDLGLPGVLGRAAVHGSQLVTVREKKHSPTALFRPQATA